MTPLPKMVPHTAAKHMLLKRYLDRWFPILGKYNQRMNYIDGFAGPGEYEDGEPGSPLLAIEAAKHHVENGTLAPNVNVNFIFVEANPDYSRHLQGKLDTLARPSQFKAGIIQGSRSKGRPPDRAWQIGSRRTRPSHRRQFYSGRGAKNVVGDWILIVSLPHKPLECP